MRRRMILALALTVACGTSSTEPQKVGVGRVLGSWSFEVQDNPNCAGAVTIGRIDMFVFQTAQDECLGSLCLGPSTRWSQAGSSKAGYVTGLLPLYLPGTAIVYLVEGDTVNGGPPLPTKSAALFGTITPDLTFAGTLRDPTDSSLEPIFSTGACTYQATGHH